MIFDDQYLVGKSSWINYSIFASMSGKKTLKVVSLCLFNTEISPIGKKYKLYIDKQPFFFSEAAEG